MSAGLRQGRPPESSAAWVAMGAAVSGVLIGGAAVYLGLQRPPVTPEPVAPPPAAELPDVEPEPVVEPDPEPPPSARVDPLADAVAATRDMVVNLETPRGLGAGVIVDPSGIVLTNYHVVDAALRPPSVGLFGRRDDSVPTLMARFENDRRIPTELLVLDPEEDLAVLRLLPPQAGEQFSAARLGSSSALRVGESVFAIGNPIGLPHSVCRGIVAAKDRTGILTNAEVGVLQLDASVNLGNSGGPLFNLDGELVGIVTAREQQAESIAFALPADHVKGFLSAVSDPQGVRSGMIGVSLDPAAGADEPARRLGYTVGLRVAEVGDGEPAAEAGLAAGDVIVALRGKRLDGLEGATTPEALARHLQATVRSMYPGEVLPLTVVRHGERVEVEVEIGSASDQDQVFIDAEDLLGLVLRRDAPAPTIDGLRAHSPLFRYADVLAGTQVVRLMGTPVPTLEAIGLRLSELRQLVRKQGATPTVFIAIRDPAGREAEIPIRVE